ncbi:TetR/AcrR family transcriptional regulator [Novosphingobium sp.]|uniref:TetR/AcrR family transcriptional regulator n=1 Tax=Novosphingobium sp. TaxID=1874826 RepID=UPI001ED16380|nr:TetR/AcrR family transcriptional regulator [Novosphingobium sp.]MBK9009378.1 TetR/AcrR family transcriptional regulator [Novosphingobium sp.]
MESGWVARQATASRTQEERTEEAKARLRDAALELFAADGYDATTLAAISLHAGFSRTLAQYHYPDKGALALELLEERILRDNHLELLDCPPDASAQQAWAALQKHLSEVTEYYGALHGGAQKSAKLRGEMAIHAAALMGSDEAISARVALLTPRTDRRQGAAAGDLPPARNDLGRCGCSCPGGVTGSFDLGIGSGALRQPQGGAADQGGTCADRSDA